MALRVEKSCPIPKTHNRLRQTHDLWHEALAAYPDADEFVTKLNACIQAARSVTFVLQKELRRTDWFEQWYAERRTRMKQDDRMRWLVEARNAIEKEGDLDTNSVAMVSVALTDAEKPIARLDVDPFLSPAVIAESLELEGIPERIRRQGVMVVERRWAVEALPDEELLDVLAHCYGVLAGIVREAHEQCGVLMRTFGGETHGSRHDREQHPSWRLPCMLPTTEARTAYWHLGDGAPIEHEVQRHSPSEEELGEIEAESRARYGDDPLSRMRPGMSSIERAEAYHHAAKILLRTDGYHRTFAWLLRGSSMIGQILMDPEDQQDKIVKLRRLATRVDEEAADEVLYTTELWYADAVDDPADARAMLRIADRDDRREALSTYLLCRSGRHRMWTTSFHRDSAGGIVLDATTEEATTGRPLFDPIFRVWDGWKAGGTAGSHGDPEPHAD